MKLLRRTTTSFVVLTGMFALCFVEAATPLNRFQRLMEGDKAMDGSTTTTTTTTENDTPMVDSWATDPVLKMAKRLIKGDHGGLLLNMAMEEGGAMEEIFKNPEVSYKLLQGE